MQVNPEKAIKIVCLIVPVVIRRHCWLFIFSFNADVLVVLFPK